MSTCSRSWCVMDAYPEEHYDHHCGDSVDLTNPPGDYTRDGWWAWLVERFGASEPVMVGFEGRAAADMPWERFELDQSQLEAIVSVLDHPTGGPELRKLLTWAD